LKRAGKNGRRGRAEGNGSDGGDDDVDDNDNDSSNDDDDDDDNAEYEEYEEEVVGPGTLAPCTYRYWWCFVWYYKFLSRSVDITRVGICPVVAQSLKIINL
jgi:hypothetical protein